MSDLGIFDPLLGRLRSDDTTIIKTTNNITQGIGNSGTNIQTGTTVPTGGSDGDIFYDTDDAILYVYANGMWNPISGGSVTPTGTWDFVDGTGVDFIDGTVGDFVA